MGDESSGLHHCRDDSYSVGVLEMGVGVEEGDEVFEALRGY